MKIKNIFDVIAEYTQSVKYGNVVPVYLHHSFVQNSLDSETILYVENCVSYLDIYLRAYNAKVVDNFFNTQVYNSLSKEYGQYLMTKWGESMEMDKLQTTDFMFPCEFGWRLLDCEGSQSSVNLSKREVSGKYTILNQGIMWAGACPPGKGALATHAKSICIWRSQIGNGVRSTPPEMAKVMLHEMLHVFGACHHDNEAYTALGDIYIEPYIITKQNKTEIEVKGFKVTNKVNVRE